MWGSIEEDVEELARRVRVFVAPSRVSAISERNVELTLKHVFLGERDHWIVEQGRE